MAKWIDISASERIGVLTRLMEQMAGLTQPQHVIDLFSQGMRQVFQSTSALQLSTRELGVGEYRIVRLANSDAAEHVVPGKSWDYHVHPVQRGGILSKIVESNRPCILHGLDLEQDPVLGETVAQSRSLAAVPVLDAEAPINWLILLHHQPDYFHPQDLEELFLRVNLVGAVSKGLWMSQQLAAANLRIAREIEQIARIQRTLLPAQLPEIPGLSIAAHYETFDRAGGDLYDFARLEGDPTTPDDDRWAILIADASGHGPAAATVCAIVHSILHAYPQEPSGPAELLKHVNRHLCAKQIESSFVTAFLAFYQPSSRELVYARAGHNPPLLLSGPQGNGQRRAIIRELDAARGLPLGIDADAAFTEDGLILEPGQMVLLYTDGVTEARNSAGEMLGPEGIERALAKCDDGAQAAVRCVTEAVLEHLGSEKASDDQTILVLEGVPTPR
jgi:sigma-B regulation protein RsbU (phosphoserine phosphatase)